MKIGNEHQVSAFIFLVHFALGNLRANNTLIVSRKFGGIQLVRHIRYVFILLIYTAYCVMGTSIIFLSISFIIETKVGSKKQHLDFYLNCS